MNTTTLRALTALLLLCTAVPAAWSQERGGRGQPAPEEPVGPPKVWPPQPDISGVWWAKSFHAKIQPLEGGTPPLNADGQKAYRANIDGMKSGDVQDFVLTLCVPQGVTRAMETPYPFRIVQTPGQVTFLFEENHLNRRVYLDTKHTGNPLIPAFMGDQTGHWDGDTLLIDTVYQRDVTWLDASGLPHSDHLHTIEHVRKINGGKQLEDVVTIIDPDMYTKEWSARFVYEKRVDTDVEDWVCGDDHRNLAGVAGAPRAQP